MQGADASCSQVVDLDMVEIQTNEERGSAVPCC